MPIIGEEWVPPSQIIAEHGLDYYQQTYEHQDLASLAKKALDKRKEMQVPEKVLEAREGFKFGCDPEGFIKNTKTGAFVTAEGLIPGTKLEPHKVKYGAVQVDGMAAEFNIDPVDNFKDFNRNIQAVINQLQKMLPADHELVWIPAVIFAEEDFNNAPDKAKELGCSPDFNAWTGDVNPPPADPDNPFLRTASGHLHIGWSDGEDCTDPQHLLNCNDLVKQFDWFLGGWSVKHDPGSTRRRLYGRAGACRYKPYGVEYRVLSNFWVGSRTTRLAVWNRMQLAINAMAKQFFPDSAPSAYNTLLQAGINDGRLNPELVRSYNYPLVEMEATTMVRKSRFGSKPVSFA
jgi:hypothetical protein